MNPKDLDDVLFQFHRAAEAVTPELVARWTGRYPQFADDIRAHAVEIVDMQQRAALAEEPLAADAVAVPQVEAVRPSLREVMGKAGTSLRDLADDLDIARSIVFDLNAGGIEPLTVPVRFVRLAAERLREAQEWLAAVIANSHDRSASPAFKATGTPDTGRRRTWEEAVNDSDMEPERKAFWLAEGP